MNPRTALLPIAGLAAGFASVVVAQTPQRPPTFEVGIEVINLNVSVTDLQNRYVTDLLDRDFAVFEDGVRQELSLFTHENLPISLALMIDVSASMDEKLPVAAAATRFIRHSLPGHQVVQFNDRVRSWGFTSTRGSSRRRRTRASGPTTMYNALCVA
jgi:VWFA-related protein